MNWDNYINHYKKIIYAITKEVAIRSIIEVYKKLRNLT